MLQIESLCAFQRDHLSGIPSTQVYTMRQNLHNSVLSTTVVRSELLRRSSMDGFFPTKLKNTRTDQNGL